MKSGFAYAIAAVATLAALVLVLNWLFPGALGREDAAPRLVHAVLLLVLVGSSLALRTRAELAESLRYGLIWVAIIAVLVLGYSLKDDFAALGQRMVATLVPSQPITSEAGEVSLRRSANGHFMARTNVTGPNLDEATVTFLVDTGASSVALTPGDARRIGIDPDRLTYNMPIRTANGTTYAARIAVKRIELGGIVVPDVSGHVIREGLSVSLLGLSFLDRLSGYSVEGEDLILRQ